MKMDAVTEKLHVIYCDNFIGEDEQTRLYENLLENITWDKSMLARQTASFGVPYNYRQMKYDETSLPEPIESIAKKLYESQIFPVIPNNCLLNYYPTASHCIGFHTDSAQGLIHGTGVAIISLGIERKIVFRPRYMKIPKRVNAGDHEEDVTLNLTPGSLLYLTDLTQLNFLHSIPPDAENCSQDKGRISMTFRCIET